jgi:hypothetical protein
VSSYVHAIYTHHEVRENLEILNIRGRGRIVSGGGRCICLLQLYLMNLGQKVVDLIVSVHELKLTLLHLLLTLLQLLLQVLNLLVLCSMELLKLTSLNNSILLCRPQKDTVSK